METVHCEAVVLKVADYRENDRLVTLFTHEHGRISGVARGAKRSQRRFGAALELFTLIDIRLKLRHGLCDLLDADVATIHPGIRSDLFRIAHSGYACELAAALTPEGVPYPRLFRLLKSYLGHMDRNPSSGSDRRFFEINLLNILGYRPSLDRCSRCGCALEDARLSLQHEVCCPLCAPAGRMLSPATLVLLSRSLATGKFGSIGFPDGNSQEAGMLLDAVISSHLSGPLRSRLFLEEIGLSSG